MIRKADRETNRLWNAGDLKIQLLLPSSDRAVGYCDGTPEDEDAIRELAEQEGLDQPVIHKRRLKTGREIWTVRGVRS